MQLILQICPTFLGRFGTPSLPPGFNGAYATQLIELPPHTPPCITTVLRAQKKS